LVQSSPPTLEIHEFSLLNQILLCLFDVSHMFHSMELFKSFD